MLTKNKNILLKDKYKKGFTLVELIIVITILAILATIAFISFQGYTKSTRDANRLATLDGIKKGLEIQLVQSSILPQPENPIIISASGEIIGYQGYFGNSDSRLTSFNKTPLDPLDNTKYTYTVSNDNKKYQVLALMETSDYLSFGDNLISKSFADNIDYSSRPPKTIGYDLGILLGTGVNLNKPIQEYLTLTGVDIIKETSYVAMINNSKSVSGSGLAILKNTLQNSYDSSLIGYWDMETTYTGSDLNPYIKDLSGNGADCLSYTGNTQTLGLKGKATLMYTGSLNSVTCYPDINSTGTFSLVLSYKLNQIGFNNTIVSSSYYDSNNSMGIFQIGLPGNQSLSYGALDGKYGFIYMKNSVDGNITKYTGKEVSNNDLTQWNTIVIIYDGQKAYLYENGKNIGTLDIDTTTLLDKRLILGKSMSKVGGIRENIKGGAIVDEIRLYNRMLTEEEIRKKTIEIQ